MLFVFLCISPLFLAPSPPPPSSFLLTPISRRRLSFPYPLLLFLLSSLLSLFPSLPLFLLLFFLFTLFFLLFLPLILTALAYLFSLLFLIHIFLRLNSFTHLFVSQAHWALYQPFPIALIPISKNPFLYRDQGSSITVCQLHSVQKWKHQMSL